jgi:hypothetical protein
VRLVADANVLLSAVTGGRARLVLARADLADVVTTVAALDEVNEYAEPPAPAARYGAVGRGDASGHGGGPR